MSNVIPGARNPPILDVRNLSVSYARADQKLRFPVVNDVSFSIRAGETVALVGQSGSGKSTIAQAVTGLLPQNGRVEGGEVLIDGAGVLGLREKAWRNLRGRPLAYIPQDPLGSLDPLKKVGDFVARSYALHRNLKRADAQQEAVDLLERVGIRDARQKAKSFPHELSGGQLQRVLIAAAIAGNPTLLVADEPTSALDVTVQDVVLDLIDELQAELNLGVLFITHDLALAKDRSDSVVVLNHGQIVERGETDSVLVAPRDAYTQQLITDAPGLSTRTYADAVDDSAARPTVEVLIAVDGLSKIFAKRTGLRGTTENRALDKLSLTIRKGTIHAIVGESGSGKTTLARVLAGLTEFDEGLVEIAGRALPARSPEINPNARELQLVYQNPLAALDPRFTVERIIREPLDIHDIHSRGERPGVVVDALRQVGLSEAVLNRKPLEISGGQRQRVAIARALALSPEILVLDEPTSALDVTVQARIIDLLLDLQRRQALTYVFISHNLGLVRQIASEVSVLNEGRLVETNHTDAIFAAPKDPYTQRLLASIPGHKVVRRSRGESSRHDYKTVT
ncbi:dipeptide ABC transporter ATP-binding protein [Frankia tisae]|uniref:dipeptide ABC transporter ATP-binding protein n=1 Tax=Frankia tisae TaxID=2950104 RepID=UPI0021BE0F0E|nr:ABC transporter ATP-binding protein [Frankia tisae]